MSRSGPGRPGKAKLEAGATGLQWAQDHARSAVMREFARIALTAGLSLGDLKREINERDFAHLTTRNVSVHFESRKPRIATIRMYASILSVTDLHLAALGIYPLAEPTVAGVMMRALRALLLRSAEFDKEAVLRVNAWSTEADSGQLASGAKAFILAEERNRHKLDDYQALQHPEFARRFGQPLAAFAESLLPDINLFQAVQSNVDYRLANVWVALGSLFTGEATDDTEHVIDFILRLLHGRKLSTTAMEKALARVKSDFVRGIQIAT